MKSAFEIKKEICEIGKRMYQNGFTPASGGSISVKVDDNTFYCTPSGVCKGFMTPDMIVKVDGKGKKLEGSMKPSSEFLSQLRIYQERPDVNAVIYGYPPVATAYASCAKALDAPLTAAIVLAVGTVPICEYGTPGTDALTEPLMPYIRDHDAFLMRNFGVITVGNSLMKAYYDMESTEHFAKVSLYADRLGGAKPLTTEQVDNLLHPCKKPAEVCPQKQATETAPVAKSSETKTEAVTDQSFIDAVTQLVMRELKK